MNTYSDPFDINMKVKEMERSPYTEIKVFKRDAAALALAVEFLRGEGQDTDVPCLVEGLLDAHLDHYMREEC